MTARRAIAAIGLVLGWGALLLWFAGISPTLPLMSKTHTTYRGSEFVGEFGQSISSDSTLKVSAASNEFSALQVRSVEIFNASRVPMLHYRFADFPRTLELVFVFRRADAPNDVRTVAVPSPRAGWTTFDLRSVPDWRNEVIEIGFAQHPVAQSMPPELAFQPFTLRDVELASPSWFGSLAALRDDWFGRRTWALMSISALGPDAAVKSRRPIVPFVAIGTAFSLVWLALVLRWRRERLAMACIAGTAIAWVALDVRWMLSFVDRHAATRIAYAGKPRTERQATLPDSALLHAARRVREQLGAGADDARMLVDAASDYERARLIYHLLPTNVAPVNLLGFGDAKHRAGLYLLIYDRDDSRFSYERLTFDSGLVLPATQLLAEGPLRLYRLDPEPSP